MVSRRTLGLAASAVALASAGSLAAQPAAAQTGSRSMTLLEVLAASRDLTVFAGLVKAAELEGELGKPGRFGFFVPHDPWFGSFEAPSRQELTADRERLRRLVLNHITTEAPIVYPGGTGGMASHETIVLSTLSGRSVSLWNGVAGVPRIEGRLIYVANVPASNGIAHCIHGLITI